jgi:bifunctional non-homologous end joining protein LigD
MVYKSEKKEKATAKISLRDFGAKSPFPKNIKPMLATLVDKAPTNEDWIYEVKWDGYRAIARCNKSHVNVISRNNKSFNNKFYPITKALEQLKLQAVLDGEIVVIKNDGTTSFEGLQNWRSEIDGELFYYVFDLLWIDGYSLLELPLHTRKKLLKELIPFEGLIVESQNFNLPVEEFLNAAKKMGLEGLIAKKNDSLYLPGIRSKEWLKIKIQKRHEVVIGGYTINENSPKLFSSLLVGVFRNKTFHYAGKIGTGFTIKAQKEMMEKFKHLKIKKCPFNTTPDVNKPSRFRPNPPPAKAVWLSPQIVCEVSYAELTSDGVMRHPSFNGIREDKNATEVHEEQPIPLSKIEKIPLRLPKIKEKMRKTFLNPIEDTQEKIIKEHPIKFNHLNKVFWPKEQYTKRDLLNYYYQVVPFILPYLKDRPQSLNRFPNGIKGLSFYQKDVTKMAPEWMKQFPYTTSLGEHKNFLVVQNETDLLWMANLGAIEMNPWNSTIQNPEYPTWCIIDIDPAEANNFIQVIEAAKATKHVLDLLQIKGYCKTSGATGLHIYIPMGAKYTYDQCQLFARMIATKVHYLLPSFTSIERLNVNRKGKVYIDFLQNRPKATLAAAYSVRPRPGAPVSMPLHWDEVKKGLDPKQFTIKNAMQRLKHEGDLFKPVLKKGINLKEVLKTMKNI